MPEPKKLVQPKPGEVYTRPVTPLDDPEFEQNYPYLFSYLTQTKWDSGSVRQTATLTMFIESGGMTVILNDRANNRSSFTNEASLFSCLMKIEVDLANGTTDWRTRRNSANGGGGATPF